MRRWVTVSAVACWVMVTDCPSARGQFAPPPGGWDYAYEANEGQGVAGAAGSGFTSLDGTWSHDNGSDEWDGSEIGAGLGRPGGVSIVTEDVGLGAYSFLRVQDTGDPRDYGMADPGSNRKIFLGHNITADGASATVVNDGVTLNFRARIPTAAPIDDNHPDGGGGVVAYPGGGDGTVLHDGGKDNIGVKGSGTGLVSFALALASDLGGAAGPGLVMNDLNGAAVTGNVDQQDADGGTLNVLPLDPTVWHDFWITIAAGGAGTHRVTVYLDGNPCPAGTFDVTAGNGDDFGGISYVAIGAGSTPQSGALDVDFLRVEFAAVAPPPDNDFCGCALAVAVPSVTAGSTAGATADAAPACGTSISAPGRWYKVTGTGTVMTAQTCSAVTNYDTKLNVYTDGCGTLTCVGGNDDACPGSQSRVDFPSINGREYLILVQGFGGEVGDYELAVTAQPPPPPNDACAGAVVIDLAMANPATVSGNTQSSTTDPENDTCGNSNAGGVWYSVVGTGGDMRATTCNAGSNYDTRLSVFSGTCGALACVGENDDDPTCALSGVRSTVAWRSVFGETYRILVHGYNTSAGNYELAVTGELPPCLEITSCRADQEAKTTHVEWSYIGPAGELEVTCNGELVATVPTSQESFDHTPVLVPGCLNPISYTVSNPALDDCAASCRVVLSPGNVCFWDDFEDYADDDALQVDGGWIVEDVNAPLEDASWTVENPCDRDNPPTFDGKPSTGRFAISDSDCAGNANPTGSGMSHDLWSPGFSTEGKKQVWLHADVSAQLNNNGKCVFDIDLSSDGGASWFNFYRRVAPSRTEAPPLADTSNADGFFGQLHVDLSAAVDTPNLQFRLRHFEPNDDWWIAVDNVIVDDVAPKTDGPECLLGPETFDAGIPGDWEVLSLAVPPNADPKTWTTSDPCTRDIAGAGGVFPHQDGRGAHRLDAPFAIMDSDCDPDPAEDEYLITPAIDCSNQLEVFLRFRSETVSSFGAVQEVLLSLDGGATFEPEPLFSYQAGGLFDSGEDPFYAVRVFKVDAAAGEPNVAFAFRYASAGDQWWWAVDDVKVSGTPIPPPGGRQRPCDYNADGNFDISDPTALLNHLFLGGPPPACGGSLEHPSAITLLDSNGDGRVDISDAVHKLNYLFLGGPAPAAGTDCILLVDCEDVCP